MLNLAVIVFLSSYSDLTWTLDFIIQISHGPNQPQKSIKYLFIYLFKIKLSYFIPKSSAASFTCAAATGQADPGRAVSTVTVSES